MSGENEEEPLHPKRKANRDQTFIHVGDKRLKKVQKVAWEAGWWPERKKKGIMWLAPDGVGQVMLHATDSDHHAFDNAVSEFRNAGLSV
ncbi:MAG TPA: hypothetical protein VF529_03850 [Solirubrobacteraceae bacterium]|jgi:hypothetical protein